MYFKNLNSVRFIAASIVIVSHIEQLKMLAGLPHQWGKTGVSLSGQFGVIVFFALSGFLITSLLLQEKCQTKRIDLRHFYIRRVLRIWPLYFLVVGLSFLVLPHIPSMQIPGTVNPLEHLALNLILFLFFLPNVQLGQIGPIAYSSQAWSIGVEEQFYLFWPVLLGMVGSAKQLRKIISLLLLGSISLKLVSYLVPKPLAVAWHLQGVSNIIPMFAYSP